MKDKWYLLYDGQSTDGRGNAKYAMRTTDVDIAKMHYCKLLHNPYSIGYVVIVTDEALTKVSHVGDFN